MSLFLLISRTRIINIGDGNVTHVEQLPAVEIPRRPESLLIEFINGESIIVSENVRDIWSVFLGKAHAVNNNLFEEVVNGKV